MDEPAADSDQGTGTMADTSEATVTGFDPELAGKRAECDGGSVDAEGHASREEFAGTLTGVFMEHGSPPTRWYLMMALTLKPPYYEQDSVWCEQGFLFVME
jgi:hypothetical protein